MKWRKLIAMLVVAALVGGFIGVPVAGAVSYANISMPVNLRGQVYGTNYCLDWEVAGQGNNSYGSSYQITAFSASIDGVPMTVGGGNPSAWANSYTGDPFPLIGLRIQGPWAAKVDGQVHTVSWTLGSVNYSGHGVSGWAAGSFQTKLIGSGVWTAAGAFGWVPPLSASITGPAGIDKALGGTWTGSASGGTGPYTYLWDYRSTEAYLNYGVDAFAGASFHRVLTTGRWFVGVQATDSKGATAATSLAVSSGSSVGAYSLRFTRYGDYGRFVDVTAWDASGEALEITASSGTQAGLPGTDGAFGWVDTANAAAVQDSWAWRYTVSLAVYGVTSPPPEMFWLKGSITIAGGVVLSFQHEFLLITEEYSTIFGADGNPVLPEIPPGPASIEPVWLVWLMSKLKETLAVLFVPQMEDINRLLPTSYLVSEWCPIGPNTFANMTSDETFVIPVFGNLRFNLDEVPTGIWTACRVLTQVSISWSLIWVMLAVIG